MNDVKIVWLSYYPEVPRLGYWDMTLLKDILRRQAWQPACGIKFADEDFTLEDVRDGEGAIVVLPARYHSRDVRRINDDLRRLSWVILFIVGDEESTFPIERIEHPRMKLWLMHPVPGRHEADHFLPMGYTPNTRPILSKYPADQAKARKWFFAGQITHARRELCLEQLKGRDDGVLLATAGFTQGMSPELFYENLVGAKIAPCPAGPATPESFRLYEALEAGCMPIADELTQDPNYPTGFWTNLFGEEPPFVTICDWASFPGYMNDVLENWPANVARVGAWWLGQKRRLSYALEDDIAELTGSGSGPREVDDLISVLIPTSPVQEHPNLAVIEETVGSVRRWLPRAEIFIMCDWVRNCQIEQYWDTYTEYLRRLAWKCAHQWENVLPIMFREHHHQAAMTRATLDHLRTPLLLFVEHDTPVVTDRPIDWEGLAGLLMAGEADMIRLHYDASIFDGHKRMMLDPAPVCRRGVPTVRTFQWSQRPHLALVSFYRRILGAHFSPDARTMIEDRMHGIVEESHRVDGSTSWFQYRLMIYAPEGNMQRSYHTDARKDDSKFEQEFTY